MEPCQFSPDRTSRIGDPHKLQRFVDAQKEVYDQVCSELRRGRKSSHWIWFIFPQIQGLGHSVTAIHYAIHSLAEADAYLRHALLGSRLRECCGLLLNLHGSKVEDIMGYPDDLKLKSSMTLFSRATADNSMFVEVLDRYFNSEPDTDTLRILGL